MSLRGGKSIPKGRPQYISDSRSISEVDEDEKSSVRGPTSPLTWLCDFAKPKTPSKPTSSSTAASKDRVPRGDIRNNPNAISFFQIDSDEELQPEVDGNGLRRYMKPPYQQAHSQQTVPSVVRSNSISAPPPMSSLGPFSPENTSLRPIQGEARIVAPNVSKLSPQSAVEVRLQSSHESVAVLCSVDVLKMRSSFFHDMLLEQERNQEVIMGAMGVMWRDAITIPESSPFEAAAFLESLHEGRVLFRGEWNVCWARLSVTWVVEDLVSEFASQIEAHMDKLTTAIRATHWRTNPSTLSGMRIAVFRKGVTPTPTVMTGTVVDAGAVIGYSKVRMAFDADKSMPVGLMASPMRSVRLPAFRTTSSQGQLATGDLLEVDSGASSPASHASQPTLSHPMSMSMSMMGMGMEPQQQMGDVCEPFWVQPQPTAAWMEPDVLSLAEVRKTLTATDRRIYWEMAKSLIDLPELSMACKSGVRCPQDIVNMLQREEYKVLWTAEGADMLTKDMAVDLIRAAYITPSEDKGK